MFCPKCGKPITSETKFCPFCGQNTQSTQDQPKSMTSSTSSVPSSNANISASATRISLQKENNQSKILTIAIIAAILALGGTGWFAKDTIADKMRSAGIAVSLADKISPAKPPIAMPPSQINATPATNDNQAKKGSPLGSVQHMQSGQILSKEFGLSGDGIQATSYGNSENGFLALQQGNLCLVDRKNHRLAYIDVQTDTFSHIKRCIQQPLTSSSVVVYFHVKNDMHGPDDEAGAWEGAMHIIPLFIEFKVNPDGTITPGLLTTGKGARPRHLQTYLYDTKNVDLGNLFITEVPAFISDAEHNGINL